MKKGLGHMIDLLAASGEVISFANVNKLLQALPQSLEEVRTKEWQEKNYANHLVDRAAANKYLTYAQQKDVSGSIEYVLSGVPRMEERLRSGIMATIDSVLFPFLKGRLAELCDGKSNLFPEDSFREGSPAIIILDLPIKQFNQSGQFVQLCFKRLWQQACERRSTKQFPTPVCQFIDEAQNFCCTRYDALFQATARSARVCSVAMTQDIHALEAQIGKPDTESLLSNFNLKIMCATDSMPTAEWASKKIGEHYALGINTSVSKGGEGNVSGGMSEQKRWVVPPDEFVRLRKGGEENDYFVEAIALRSGRPFVATNSNHIRLRFPQKIAP